MKPAHPWSAVTALIFPLLGYVGWEIVQTPESAVVALAYAALGAGTGWRHWSPSARSSRWDQTAMHGAFSSLILAGLGLPWFLVVPGAGGVAYLLEWRLNLSLRKTMGGYVAVALIEAFILGEWWMPVVAATLMGGGLYVRDRLEDTPDEDLFHGAWHISSGCAMFILFLAIV